MRTHFIDLTQWFDRCIFLFLYDTFDHDWWDFDQSDIWGSINTWVTTLTQLNSPKRTTCQIIGYQITPLHMFIIDDICYFLALAKTHFIWNSIIYRSLVHAPLLTNINGRNFNCISDRICCMTKCETFTN